MTADYLIRSTYPVAQGDAVLIYAAAGGVGQLATQMALQAGGRVIATVGRAAKALAVEALGVEKGDIIDLGALKNLATSLPPLIKDLTDSAGVDAAYDGIGLATFKATLASLKPRGMAVLYGGASGQVPPLDPQELNAHGSLYLTRPKLSDYTATTAELHQRAERVFNAAITGELKVSIGERFALSSAADAHRALESGSNQGKLVLIPN
jgi:NADPH2:quinone reductase